MLNPAHVKTAITKSKFHLQPEIANKGYLRVYNDFDPEEAIQAAVDERKFLIKKFLKI